MVSKDFILGTVEDLAKSFLVHDRRNDEDLPAGSIEEAIIAGEVTPDEITERFQTALWKELGFD